MSVGSICCNVCLTVFIATVISGAQYDRRHSTSDSELLMLDVVLRLAKIAGAVIVGVIIKSIS